MKTKTVQKKLDLDSFTKFQVNNLKFIFGGTEDPIEKKKLRRPGR
tara:strand:- start:270 stop:404 length:135 start_codon:yes stop_codon:yes gene_type:complete